MVVVAGLLSIEVMPPLTSSVVRGFAVPIPISDDIVVEARKVSSGVEEVAKVVREEVAK